MVELGPVSWTLPGAEKNDPMKDADTGGSGPVKDADTGGGGPVKGADTGGGGPVKDATLTTILIGQILLVIAGNIVPLVWSVPQGPFRLCSLLGNSVIRDPAEK